MSNIIEKDIVIIGAGIAGLYASYRLGKNINAVIIEKEKYIGGRALNQEFHGMNITFGAGIMEDKNPNVLGLVHRLGIAYDTFDSITISKDYSKEEVESFTKMASEKIKNTYEQNKDFIKKNLFSFHQFLIYYFGEEFTRKCIELFDYTDFLSADVQKTMDLYPFSDLFISKAKYHYIKGGWKVLIDRLMKERPTEIKLEERVVEIENLKDSVIVKTNKNIYKSKFVYICGNLDIKQINFINYDISFLEKIGSIPFMRGYSYHVEGHGVKSTIKTKDLQDKLIPMGKNILMVVYNDNCKARELNNLLGNKYNYELLGKILKHYKTPITDFVHKYWEHGIHYYKPTVNDEIIYKPKKTDRIVFLGEMVSRMQGWVEGAIRSVDDYFEIIKYQ